MLSFCSVIDSIEKFKYPIFYKTLICQITDNNYTSTEQGHERLFYRRAVAIKFCNIVSSIQSTGEVPNVCTTTCPLCI